MNSIVKLSFMVLSLQMIYVAQISGAEIVVGNYLSIDLHVLLMAQPLIICFLIAARWLL